MTKIRVLAVDDEAAACAMLAEQIRALFDMEVDGVHNGEDALGRLRDYRYDVVITDKNMPGMSGLDLLRQVHVQWPRLELGLISGYAEFQDLVNALNGCGVSFFLAKPWQMGELQMALSTAAERIRLRRENEKLITDLERRNQEITALNESLEGGFVELVRLLSDIVQYSAPTLSQHSQQVANLALAVARELGAPEAGYRHLETAATLHDIGLLGTSEETWRQPPGRLSGTARRAYERHARLGAQMLQATPELRQVRTLILCHHENLDGTGLLGLDGAQLPLGARILRVCDYYSANTSLLDRDPEDVINLMNRHQGDWFDADCLRSLMDVLARMGGRVVVPLAVSRLRVGMEIARDVINPRGRILMASGAILTRNNLRRLTLQSEIAPLGEVYVRLPADGLTEPVPEVVDV